MTLTLLDLYNHAATQEWSMYDNDVIDDSEFEKSLVLAINKAVQEIMYSYPYSFRDRTHVILTVEGINSYDIPYGIIKKTQSENYIVKLNSKYLNFIENPDELDEAKGMPTSFYIKGDKIVLYPTPDEQFIVTIDYITLTIGEDIENNEIYVLKNKDDSVLVPVYLEELFKNAVIARTMLNSIASESDENYSAYKKQSETAYKMLVKYSKGVWSGKKVQI